MSEQQIEDDNSTESRTPEADLALIKSIMMTGRRRMGIDGTHLVIWGLILGAAFFTQYISVEGYIPLMRFGIWIPAYALGTVISAIVARRAVRPENENNLALEVYAIGWSSVGSGIALYFVLSLSMGNFDHMTITFLTTAGFGGAFRIMSVITGLHKLRYVAYGWWGLLSFFALVGDIGPNLLIVLCAASLLLLALPGYLLKRMIGEEG